MRPRRSSRSPRRTRAGIKPISKGSVRGTASDVARRELRIRERHGRTVAPGMRATLSAGAATLRTSVGPTQSAIARSSMPVGSGWATMSPVEGPRTRHGRRCSPDAATRESSTTAAVGLGSATDGSSSPLSSPTWASGLTARQSTESMAMATMSRATAAGLHHQNSGETEASTSPDQVGGARHGLPPPHRICCAACLLGALAARVGLELVVGDLEGDLARPHLLQEAPQRHPQLARQAVLVAQERVSFEGRFWRFPLRAPSGLSGTGWRRGCRRRGLRRAR